MNSAELVQLARVRAMARNGTARRIRLDADVSLSQVAAVCGVSATTVHRWESAIDGPTGRPALAYADLLDELDAAVPARRRRVKAAG